MAQALIVIDIQEGLVKENPYNAKNFISNTKAIIQHFRYLKYRSHLYQTF